MTDYDQRHGGPYDRGSANSYYGGIYDPHFWPAGTGKGARIGKGGMTPDELEAFEAGWIENEASGDRKNWG